MKGNIAGTGFQPGPAQSLPRGANDDIFSGAKLLQPEAEKQPSTGFSWK